MASKKFGVSDIEVTGNLSVTGVGVLGVYTDIDKNVNDLADDSSALRIYNPGDGPCLTVDSGDPSKPVFQISHDGIGSGSGYFNLSSFDSYRPTQTGTAITSKAVDSTSTFGTDDEVYQYYRDNIGFFDMDQDGVVSPSDTLILMRGLFGGAFSGNALTNNAVMGTGTYTNSDYDELYDRIQVMKNAPYTQNVNVGITTTILTGVTTSQVIVGNNYPVGASTFIAANTEVTAIGSGEVTISKATTNTVSLTGVAVTFGMASHGYGMLDVDGSGSTTALGDGLMILRMVGQYGEDTDTVSGNGFDPADGHPTNLYLEPIDFGPPRSGSFSDPRIGIGTQPSNTKSLSIVGSSEIKGSVDLTGDLIMTGYSSILGDSVLYGEQVTGNYFDVKKQSKLTNDGKLSIGSTTLGSGWRGYKLDVDDGLIRSSGLDIDINDIYTITGINTLTSDESSLFNKSYPKFTGLDLNNFYPLNIYNSSTNEKILVVKSNSNDEDWSYNTIARASYSGTALTNNADSGTRTGGEIYDYFWDNYDKFDMDGDGVVSYNDILIFIDEYQHERNIGIIDYDRSGDVSGTGFDVGNNTGFTTITGINTTSLSLGTYVQNLTLGVGYGSTITFISDADGGTIGIGTSISDSYIGITTTFRIHSALSSSTRESYENNGDIIFPTNATRTTDLEIRKFVENNSGLTTTFGFGPGSTFSRLGNIGIHTTTITGIDTSSLSIGDRVVNNFMPSYTTLITSIGNGEVGIGTTTTNTSIQDDASFEFGSTGYDINNTGSVDLLNDIILLGRITLGLSDGGANYPVTINTGEYNVGIKSSKPERTLDVVGSIRKTVYEPGEIIEEISGICDGSTIVVKSGSYTLADVTAIQEGTISYQTITGSQISYTPPVGTKRVVYSFYYKWDAVTSSGISHSIMNIDGNDVYPSAMTVAGSQNSTYGYATAPVEIRMTINCDADTNDVNNGKFTSWTSPKTLNVQFREYNETGYQAQIHANVWWNGTSATGNYIIMKPHLTIRAIA